MSQNQPGLPAKPSASDLSAVRNVMLQAGFTADGVLDRIGAPAYAAIARHELVPLRRAVQGASDPLGTLIRLFLLHEAVPRAFAAEALGSALPAALGLGLVAEVETDAGQSVRPLLDVRPYGEPDTDWFAVADIGGPSSPEHVLGIGGASLTLARITPRPEGARTFDLGVGCGIQALHASRHSRSIVISDTNPHALEVAMLTLGLSGVDIARVEPRLGSLTEPVAGERFDLIVSNPPFVISPGKLFTYRDGGLEADEIGRRVVSEAPDHLNPGGWAAVLANWLHLPGLDWRDRVARWLEGVPADAWVLQRDFQDVNEYVELWMRDSDEHTPTSGADGSAYADRYLSWLDYFGDAEGVGFGWIVLRQTDSPEPLRIFEESPSGSRLPTGEEVEEWFTQVAAGSPSASEVLGSTVRFSPGVALTEQVLVTEAGPQPGMVKVGRPGLHGPGGWRSEILIDPRLARLLAAPDAALGELVDDEDLLVHALIGVRELHAEGLVALDLHGPRNGRQ